MTMSGEVLSQVLATAAITALVTTLVIWLFQLGKAKPGVAYFSPIATAFAVLLTLFFVSYGVVNRLYGEHQSIWMDALCFGGGLAFLIGAIDSAYYRLRWDGEGFSVRRFVGRSFTARWSEVKSIQWIPGEYGGEYRVELEHPEKRAFNFSSFLVGSKDFAAALRRKTPFVAP
jgi:hypothetical protein